MEGSVLFAVDQSREAGGRRITITIGRVSIYTYMYAVLTQINAFFFPLNTLLVMLLFFFFALPLPRVSMSVCLFVAWLVCQWEKHKTTEQENEDESWLRRDPINSWFGSKYRDGSSNYLLTFFNIVMLAIFPTFSFQMKTNQALFGGWNLRESTE